MKYNRLHINHFGRLQNRTVEFRDGIHVITGPNESGKSTLHAFLEAMLFGLPRGRGRHAKQDNYHRYFPEEGSSTYGGVLEFTQDDTLYAIYRNFRKDPTGFTLMDETHSRQLSPTEEEYRELLSGLTLPLYRNTVSLRQLEAATSSELPEQLRSHIVNLRSTGSGSLDLKKAGDHLKKQKKQLEAALDPQAEKEAEDLRRQIAEGYEKLSAAPDPSGLAGLEEKAERLALAEKHKEEQREELLEELHRQEKAGRKNTGGAGVFLLMILFAAALLQLILPIFLPAVPAVISRILPFTALLTLVIAGIFCVLRVRRRKPRSAGTDPLISLRREEEAVTERLLHLKELDRRLAEQTERLRQALSRREELEAQLRSLEERLDALEPALMRNREIAEDLAAVELADETIRRLASTAFESFGSYLQETASTLIRQITGGRYSRLMIDDEMHITLEQDHQPVELGSLSVSTIDQVYLALRIACIEFFWPEESIPLLLDESFAMYDADRITETLSWLAENYPGQVFLFTCQNRESEVLQQAGIAHLRIEL